MMNKIPKGWEKYYLSDCFNAISIKNKIKTKDYLPQGKFPIIDQGQDFISGYSNDENLLIKIKKPIIIFGDHTRCFKFINFDFIAGADGIKILEPKDNFNEKLFYYFCQILDFPNKGYSRHFQYLKKAIINFPKNLSEQKAIVDKLDDSFAKIENAITNLINAKENLKLYKQSVLKSAFNGDLLSNTSPTHWEVKKLGEIFNVIGGGTPNTNNAEFWGGNISWISSADIDKENFNAIPRKFITENAIQNSATNLVPKNTIIVVTRVGLGKVAITKEPMCFSQDSQALIPFEKINVKFMAYQIKQIAQNFINISRGTTINGITKQNLKDCKICVPPLSEQNLIVAEIDRRFAIVDKTLNLIDKSIQNAKNLKQSILKKAFSGELRSDI